MELFTTEGGVVTPIPEVLLIHPFKDIWERDKSTHKVRAIAEFTYIEFLCSYKKSNPYIGFPEKIRESRIRENIFRADPQWEPDEIVTQAIEAYRDFQLKASPSIRFYEAALIGVDKLQDYYINLDMKKATAQGGLVNKPSDVARGLSQTAGVLQNLESLKEKVQQELFESNKIRANRVVNPFER